MQTDINLLGRWRACGVAMLAAVAIVLAGCQENRINVEQFIQMQKELQAKAHEQAETDMAPAAAQTLVDTAMGPYRIGPGDVLGVVFTGFDQASLFQPFQVRVHRDGRVLLPVVGELQVAGLELEDAERKIHTAFIPAVVKDAAVHVSLVAPEQTHVLVTGAVTMPGLVSLRSNQRDVLRAITAAGGFFQSADGTATLQRVRHPGKKTDLTLTTADGLRATLAEAPLEDGDIVTVNAATPNTVFVGGLVNAPLPQMYPPGVEVTVLQALAASAGLRTDVIPTEATLIRRLPDDTDVQVKLDLGRIQRGEDPNLVLAAGDILWVPETIGTKVHDWLNRNIYFRAGASATVNYNVSGIEFMNRHNTQSRGSGGSGGSLEDSFDPLGFLGRNAALQSLTSP